MECVRTWREGYPRIPFDWTLYTVMTRKSEVLPWPPGQFEDLYDAVEPPLRHALIARFGRHHGSDATQLALAWAWEHYVTASQVTNPVAYLFRVGSSKLAEQDRNRETPHEIEGSRDLNDDYPNVDLVRALRQLTHRQRTICYLVHGLGWSQADVADGLAISPSTVHEHLTSAMRKLTGELSKEALS